MKIKLLIVITFFIFYQNIFSSDNSNNVVNTDMMDKILKRVGNDKLFIYYIYSTKDTLSYGNKYYDYKYLVKKDVKSPELNMLLSEKVEALKYYIPIIFPPGEKIELAKKEILPLLKEISKLKFSEFDPYWTKPGPRRIKKRCAILLLLCDVNKRPRYIILLSLKITGDIEFFRKEYINILELLYNDKQQVYDLYPLYAKTNDSINKLGMKIWNKLKIGVWTSKDINKFEYYEGPFFIPMNVKKNVIPIDESKRKFLQRDIALSKECIKDRNKEIAELKKKLEKEISPEEEQRFNHEINELKKDNLESKEYWKKQGYFLRNNVTIGASTNYSLTFKML